MKTHGLHIYSYTSTHLSCLCNSCICIHACVITTTYAQYSQKYWWELNLAVGSQIAIANVLVDLNLAVAQAVHQYKKLCLTNLQVSWWCLVKKLS